MVMHGILHVASPKMLLLIKASVHIQCTILLLHSEMENSSAQAKPRSSQRTMQSHVSSNDETVQHTPTTSSMSISDMPNDHTGGFHGKTVCMRVYTVRAEYLAERQALMRLQKAHFDRERREVLGPLYLWEKAPQMIFMTRLEGRSLEVSVHPEPCSPSPSPRQSRLGSLLCKLGAKVYQCTTIVGSGFGQKFRDMTRKKKSTGITGTRPGDPLGPIPVGSGSLMALLAPQTRSPGMWVPLHHHGSQAARPPEFFGTGPSGRPSRMTHGPARPPNYIQRVVPWVVLAVGWPW